MYFIESNIWYEFKVEPKLVKSALLHLYLSESLIWSIQNDHEFYQFRFAVRLKDWMTSSLHCLRDERSMSDSNWRTQSRIASCGSGHSDCMKTPRSTKRVYVSLVSTIVSTHSRTHRNSLEIAWYLRSIIPTFAPHHTGSILEHRIVLQDLVYIFIYIGASIFIVCSPSARSLTTVKTRLSFPHANFSIAKPALRFFYKTNGFGRIARAIFLETIEYRVRNRTKLPRPKGESPSSEEGSVSGLPKRRFAPVFERFFFYLDEPRANHDYLWFSTTLYSKRRYLFSSVYQRWRILHCKESIEIYVRYSVLFFFFFTIAVPDGGDNNYRHARKRRYRERYSSSRETVCMEKFGNGFSRSTLSEAKFLHTEPCP